MVPGMTSQRMAIAGAASAAVFLAAVVLLVVRDDNDPTVPVVSGAPEVSTTVTVDTTAVPAPSTTAPSTTAPSTAAAVLPTTTTSPPRATTAPARPSSTMPATPPPGQALESQAGGHAAVAAALADARAKWARSKPANGYTWTYDNNCFCYPRKLEVTVDGAGRVTGTRNLDEPGSAVTTPGRTVEGAFDELKGAIDGDAASIRVRFDAARGFPSSYFVDRSRQLADEEQGLTVVDFRARS